MFTIFKININKKLSSYFLISFALSFLLLITIYFYYSYYTKNTGYPENVLVRLTFVKSFSNNFFLLFYFIIISFISINLYLYEFENNITEYLFSMPISMEEFITGKLLSILFIFFIISGIISFSVWLLFKILFIINGLNLFNLFLEFYFNAIFISSIFQIICFLVKKSKYLYIISISYFAFCYFYKSKNDNLNLLNKIINHSLISRYFNPLSYLNAFIKTDLSMLKKIKEIKDIYINKFVVYNFKDKYLIIFIIIILTLFLLYILLKKNKK